MPLTLLDTFVELIGARIVLEVIFPFNAKKHFRYMCKSSPIASLFVSHPPTLSAKVRGRE
jgi:hypothetical protein